MAAVRSPLALREVASTAPRAALRQTASSVASTPFLVGRPLSLRSTAAASRPQQSQSRPSPRCDASTAIESPEASPRQFASLASAPMVSFSPESGPAPSFPAASGVYAVYDKAGALQYMGLSRRLNASLKLHLSELPELCGSAKYLEVPSSERSVMVAAWKEWMEEHVAATGAPPPGNAAGNATWTTRKAARVKPEIRLTPGPNTQLTVPLAELIGKVVQECKVVAFIKGTRSAPQCGFSVRVLGLLTEAGAEFEVLNVLDEDHNPGLRDAIKEFSQWPTIPQIYINGEFIGGADILDEMAQSGQLKEALAQK